MSRAENVKEFAAQHFVGDVDYNRKLQDIFGNFVGRSLLVGQGMVANERHEAAKGILGLNIRRQLNDIPGVGGMLEAPRFVGAMAHALLFPMEAGIKQTALADIPVAGGLIRTAAFATDVLANVFGATFGAISLVGLAATPFAGPVPAVGSFVMAHLGIASRIAYHEAAAGLAATLPPSKNYPAHVRRMRSTAVTA